MTNRTTAIASLAVLLSTLFCISPALNRISDKSVFNWTKRKMEIEEDYPIPFVRRVTKAQLQRLYTYCSAKSYRILAEKAGKEAADETLKMTLENLLAFFHPKTWSIYVDSSVSQLEKNSRIAHEFCHYLQEKTLGPADPDLYFEMEHWRREIKAYAIQEKYMESHSSTNRS